MSEQTLRQSISRQAWVRWPCQPDGTWGGDNWSAFQFCAARVVGLTAREICIVLKERPALQTILAVQLLACHTVSRPLLARVKYTRPKGRDVWLTRCEFLSRLSPAVLSTSVEVAP